MFRQSVCLFAVMAITDALCAGMFHSQCANSPPTSAFERVASPCGSPWFDKTVCDVNRWSLVYENDDKGKTIYGRRCDLATALRDGVALTLYVPHMKYAVQAEHVHIEHDEVCAQFWKHASFRNWMSFQTNVYWWIFLVCTTGYAQATRYYVGGNYISRSNYSYALRWYVKYSYRLRPVLTQDDAGWVVSGSVGGLRDAVLAGKAVNALMGDNAQADLLPLTNVAVRMSQVIAQSVNRVSLKPCKDGRCQFSDTAIWLSYVISTGGGYIVESRRVVDTAARLSDVHQQTPVSWLVDDCWTLAFVHDGVGQMIQGCLEGLREAVRAGHRVRVRLPGLQDMVAEADGVQINNGVVSGYFLSLFSDNTDEIPNVAPEHATYAVWMTVSTSGVVRMRRQKLGSPEVGKKIKRAFDCIMWFIDKRPWQLMLSVDSKGTVTAGSKEALVEAVKRGASVRYAAKSDTEGLSLIGAHNLHLSGNDVSAENILCISLKMAADNPGDIEFQDNPYWYFTIITTTGRCEASRWTYGKHQSRSRNVQYLPVDWFILY